MNFIISHYNLIFLVILLVLFIATLVRYFRPQWVKNISYPSLIIIVLLFRFLSDIFLTSAQYIVWGKGGITKILLDAPLPAQVPFPALFEIARPLFVGAHGYFAYFAIAHFFLATLVLLLITGLFWIFFSLYKKQKEGNFREGDIAIILLTFLIAGWPGVVVLVPVAFFVAVVMSISSFFFMKVKHIDLALAFLLAAPIALIFSSAILSGLNMYLLLKL